MTSKIPFEEIERQILRAAPGQQSVQLTESEKVLVLEWAAKNNRLELLRAILQDVDIGLDDKIRAFIDAAERGHTQIVKLLLEAENVDQTVNRNNAIKKAAANGHVGTVRILLLDKNGRYKGLPYATALYEAAKHNQLQVIRSLLSIPNATAYNSVGEAAKLGYLEAVKLLVPYSKQNELDIAFDRAAKNGQLEVVKYLVNNNIVDPSVFNNIALERASSAGQVAVVDFLLKDKRVDPENDIMPLRRAIANEHVAVVRRLLEDDRIDPSQLFPSDLVRSLQKSKYAAEISTMIKSHPYYIARRALRYVPGTVPSGKFISEKIDERLDSPCNLSLFQKEEGIVFDQWANNVDKSLFEISENELLYLQQIANNLFSILYGYFFRSILEYGRNDPDFVSYMKENRGINIADPIISFVSPNFINTFLQYIETKETDPEKEDFLRFVIKLYLAKLIEAECDLLSNILQNNKFNFAGTDEIILADLIEKHRKLCVDKSSKLSDSDKQHMLSSIWKENITWSREKLQTIFNDEKLTCELVGISLFCNDISGVFSQEEVYEIYENLAKQLDKEIVQLDDATSPCDLIKSILFEKTLKRKKEQRNMKKRRKLE